MRVAVVHYHLRRGGVTRVIASAVRALGKNAEVVVLSSTPPDEPLDCPVGLIEELAYGETDSQEEAARLYRNLKKQAHDALGSDPDVWHIHNHSLGKNANFPEAIRHLIASGARVLLQIHDFAEDGRPGNFRARNRPYLEGTFTDPDTAFLPNAPQVGYAVLNRRDHTILATAGIPKDRIFLLPNAVLPPDDALAGFSEPGKVGHSPLILYPTRGIRRKNLGELLLMAMVNPQNRYATTLTPDNPRWRPVHDAWVSLAGELRLPVEFGLGERPSARFPALIAEAQALVTTSVGEGFGLAFLEPWLMDRSVCGRDLPDITSDFKDNGIRLTELYAEWPVPCHLFSVKALRQRFISGLKQAYHAYGRDLKASAAEEAFEKRTANGTADFGFLDETAQAEVLRRAAHKPAVLEPPFTPGRGDSAIITANKALVRDVYGIDRYGSKLHATYSRLAPASSGALEEAHSSAILNAFLSPDGYLPLRS